MVYSAFNGGELGEIRPESVEEGASTLTYFVWESVNGEGIFFLKDVDSVTKNTKEKTFTVTLRDGTDIVSRDEDFLSDKKRYYSYEEFKSIFIKDVFIRKLREENDRKRCEVDSKQISLISEKIDKACASIETIEKTVTGR